LCVPILNYIFIKPNYEKYFILLSFQWLYIIIISNLLYIEFIKFYLIAHLLTIICTSALLWGSISKKAICVVVYYRSMPNCWFKAIIFFLQFNLFSWNRFSLLIRFQLTKCLPLIQHIWLEHEWSEIYQCLNQLIASNFLCSITCIRFWWWYYCLKLAAPYIQIIFWDYTILFGSTICTSSLIEFSSNLFWIYSSLNHLNSSKAFLRVICFEFTNNCIAIIIYVLIINIK